MTTDVKTLALSASLIAALVAVPHAQAPATRAASKPAGPGGFESAGPLVPLKVQVVIARYQGDRKVSSLPYTLSVNANDGQLVNGQFMPNNRSSLRMGAQVAVPAVAFAAPEGKPAGPMQYKDIGTNIDCFARKMEDGRFTVSLTIEDTSVYPDGQSAQAASSAKDFAAFRSFRFNNSLILKDGQSAQFTAATDKISGETITIDVTVSALK